MNKQVFIVLATLLVTVSLFAQRRGDQLAFQGLATPQDVGVKAMAMGGATTALSGDLGNLFRNPAGLAGITSLQLSIGSISQSRSWQENQEYRPNRIYQTLPFYLEGLYTPEARYNGMWDHELAGTLGFDSVTYEIREPDMGLDPFSDEAADWKQKLSESGLNNVMAAMPFALGGRQLVVAAGYSQNILIDDFDRNDTYLDPHIGFNLYGNPPVGTTTDTVSFNWHRFLRERDGNVTNINGAVAVQAFKMLELGVAVNVMSAETDDRQLLDKVGYFDLVGNNKFRFSYDTLTTQTTGKSDFSATRFDLGMLLKFQRFNVGAKIGLPYTIARDWQLSSTNTTVNNGIGTATTTNSSGTDEIDVPATFQLGLSVTPVDNFTFAMDIDIAPYGDADYRMTSQPMDSLFQKWADYRALRFGIEYRATEFLSVMGGYRSLPVTFVPDGAAFDDEGPASDSYSFGASLKLWNLGRIDAAYEWRRLRYHDSYYSNTNYVQESLNNFYLGYAYQF
ncbi:MAG: outer membrane protein transport protein [Calditrichia bacterium]